MTDDFAFPKVPVELRPLFIAVCHVVMDELREPGERAGIVEATLSNRIRHVFEAAATAAPVELPAVPERQIVWTCSICLYDGVDWGALDEDQLAERRFLAVINGQMTCEYHASIVGSGEHGMALLFAKRQGMRS